MLRLHGGGGGPPRFRLHGFPHPVGASSSIPKRTFRFIPQEREQLLAPLVDKLVDPFLKKELEFGAMRRATDAPGAVSAGAAERDATEEQGTGFWRNQSGKQFKTCN